MSETEPRVGFRPLATADLSQLCAWFAEPEIARWWNMPATLDAVSAKYQPRIDGIEPTRMWILEVDGIAAGLLQSYRHVDHSLHDAAVGIAGAVGIDYLIGSTYRGLGLAARILGDFAAFALDLHPDALAVVATPAQTNEASWRALERAGFRRVRECQPPDEPPAYAYSLDRVTRSVAAYTGVAREYEATHASKMADRVERFVRDLPVPSRILDAGCGPGRDLRRFVAAGHEPYGVDMNQEFVAIASGIAPTVHADLRDIAGAFVGARFDAVWAASSLVHLTEAEAAATLGQLARLARPGARLYACVTATGESGWHDEPDGRRYYTVWTATDFAATVAAAGFVVDDIVDGPFVEVWARRRA